MKRGDPGAAVSKILLQLKRKLTPNSDADNSFILKEQPTKGG